MQMGKTIRYCQKALFNVVQPLEEGLNSGIGVGLKRSPVKGSIELDTESQEHVSNKFDFVDFQ